MSILSIKPSRRIWAELSRGHYVHCRGLAGMIRKHRVELQQDRPTTAADGAVLSLWWPDRTQPMASGSTPIMRVNMQLATSPTWRWSHQNCLNMCLESYNHAVSPPGKEEPCIYTKAAFASQFKTTSTSTHRQTKVR